MTVIVEIDGYTFAPVRITGANVLTMTRAGILPEGRGHELIDGVLVGSAMRGSAHMRMVGILIRRLCGLLSEEVAIAPTPSLLLSEDTLLEPDICLYPDAMESTDLRGPDLLLVIEVSYSTLRNDLGKKAQLYAAHGVAHCWVVDVTGERLHRHTGPGEGGYADVTVSGPDEAVPLPMSFASDGTTLHMFG